MGYVGQFNKSEGTSYARASGVDYGGRLKGLGVRWLIGSRGPAMWRSVWLGRRGEAADPGHIDVEKGVAAEMLGHRDLPFPAFAVPACLRCSGRMPIVAAP